MIQSIKLNDHIIDVENYEEETINGLTQVSVDFKVNSENYHDIAVLLYEGTFDVIVPEKEKHFRGTITQYYTSVTNLYKEGEIGDYHVRLLEIAE
ncbi:DUF3219 family protein [Cytobacillus purgationiresistens]|uniref:DUF3219 domain-containing protein n=1 Tax=Cytobacillus purgationiresistens TaxID=863449 RepID=A0ABU0AAJ6_9BACI|nr:DUF3219 family protein [Cytobacillus purgationiresistens]MDQ0268270.1 hypothetical protein [Cytobacillus purgationiresistens]